MSPDVHAKPQNFVKIRAPHPVYQTLQTPLTGPIILKRSEIHRIISNSTQLLISLGLYVERLEIFVKFLRFCCTPECWQAATRPGSKSNFEQEITLKAGGIPLI